MKQHRFIAKNADATTSTAVTKFMARASRSNSSSNSGSRSCPSPAACPGRSCPNDCGVDCEEGAGDLEYLPIFDDNFADMAQAIYHQYLFGNGTTIKELEDVRDLKLPINKVLKGTAASKKGPVYGYEHKTKKGNNWGFSHNPSVHRGGSYTKLVLNGGKEKSYNDNFKNVTIRYHGASQAELIPTIQASDIERSMAHIISYYAERGFPLQAPDVPVRFTDQFIWTWGAGQYQGINSPGFLSMRFIYDETCDNKKLCKVPKFVDVIATATYNYYQIDTYEPNPLARKNQHYYPVRLPVTRDYCKFIANQETPMAYYDEECQAITVSIPEGDYPVYGTDLTYLCDGALFDWEYSEAPVYLFGTFSLLKRSCDGDSQLVKAEPWETEMLAQISPFLFIGSYLTESVSGYEEFGNMALPIRADVGLGGDSYIGAVLPLMNGGSTAFDIYTTFGDFNSYVGNEDPFSGVGNNPTTTLNEVYGSFTTINALVNEWSLQFGRISEKVMLSDGHCPEFIQRLGAIDVPSDADAFSTVLGHEFGHVSQLLVTSITALGLEGLATGLEMDFALNRGMVAWFRGPMFATVMIQLARGDFGLMYNADMVSYGFNTYGLGMMWSYLREQVDANNQVQRMLGDLLTTELLAPILQAADINVIAYFTANQLGGLVTLDTALRRLYKWNIKKFAFRFMVAMAFMRPNEAIPKKYRMLYPYYLWSQQNQSYADITNAVELIRPADPTFTSWANFWDQMENNTPISPAAGSPYTGETFYPTLDPSTSISLPSTRGLIFNVPNGLYGTINVAADQGEWKVILAQFTSKNGCCKGKWVQDGPYRLRDGESKQFELFGSRGQDWTSTGNTRLILVNITDLPGDGSDCQDWFGEEAITGSVSIEAI